MSPRTFSGIMGKEAWWAVPVAVTYRSSHVQQCCRYYPHSAGVAGKRGRIRNGVAFMMAVIAISTPEVIILRKVLKPRLIEVFIGVVTVGIILVGYLFNIVL